MSHDNQRFQNLLERYLQGPSDLSASVRGLDPAALEYRPPIDGAWTISEHVRHVVDNDFNFILRAKMSLAEPGVEVMLLDEEAWARTVYRVPEDLEAYLALFAALRHLFGDFLRKLDPETVSQAWIRHPKRGPLPLIDLLALYAEHVPFHLDYIRRNLEAWRQARG